MVTAEPRDIIEILSPSTTRYDRFQKLEEYKRVDAVKVVLLVDTESPPLRSGVEVHRAGASTKKPVSAPSSICRKSPPRSHCPNFTST
jgi:Uma2 family endonuclease